MAHIESTSESSLSEDEVASGFRLQTGTKCAGQVPGPKTAAKRAKKQQIFVDSWLQHSAFKMWLGKKVGSDGKLEPWCKTCDKELNCSKTGLNRHLKSKSHEKSQASTSFTGNVDDIWKRVASNNNDRAKSMEIKICASLAEYNLPISLSDGLVEFPLSNFKKNKTIDTPKIVNILFNVSTRLQSSSGMTLLRNAERYIYKLGGSNYALIKYHKFLRGSSSVVKFWFLAMYM